MEAERWRLQGGQWRLAARNLRPFPPLLFPPTISGELSAHFSHPHIHLNQALKFSPNHPKIAISVTSEFFHYRFRGFDRSPNFCLASSSRIRSRVSWLDDYVVGLKGLCLCVEA
ncbi:hypothetical protein Droror1_Dr00013339 [Drosera rotundifolia]